MLEFTGSGAFTSSLVNDDSRVGGRADHTQASGPSQAALRLVLEAASQLVYTQAAVAGTFFPLTIVLQKTLLRRGLGLTGKGLSVQACKRGWHPRLCELQTQDVPGQPRAGQN